MPNEEAEGEELRVITSSGDLDDYDILSTMSMSVAVPHDTTENFRKLIWAAMATYGFGNSSVDHVMRRYGFMWDKRTDKSFQRDPRMIALRTVVHIVNAAADALNRISPAESLGPICSKAALVRLEASFKAAYGLVRREYIFEVDAVVRLILEQIAWALAVYSVAGNEVHELLPTKCIGRLKEVFPGCGPLYGALSQWAHIDPALARNYVDFHNAGIDVVRRSDVNSFESGANIIALAPVYLDVVQKLFAPLPVDRYEEMRGKLAEMRAQYNVVAQSGS
jgi:hypothetical protein